MNSSDPDLGNLVAEKVKRLSVEQIIQVNKFIDSLEEQDPNTELTFASNRVAESAFSKVWDNPEDAEYDNL